ncbi:hypothetical protein BpHYR1_043325 [Brachionus plicatilis]|uniref:Uncharacterized protein n=1 Tax=Brachionus plicatilis TaxID=10195 RepID=A0A3M7QIE3_BRAPC|nr:hypothetical protein BpHYR1_043325 [Brachionus plicatilis]
MNPDTEKMCYNLDPIFGLAIFLLNLTVNYNTVLFHQSLGFCRLPQKISMKFHNCQIFAFLFLDINYDWEDIHSTNH